MDNPVWQLKQISLDFWDRIFTIRFNVVYRREFFARTIVKIPQWKSLNTPFEYFR